MFLDCLGLCNVTETWQWGVFLLVRSLEDVLERQKAMLGVFRGYYLPTYTTERSVSLVFHRNSILIAYSFSICDLFGVSKDKILKIVEMEELIKLQFKYEEVSKEESLSNICYSCKREFITLSVLCQACTKEYCPNCLNDGIKCECKQGNQTIDAIN